LIINKNLGEKQLRNKLIVILVVLGFILSSIAVVSGEQVSKYNNMINTNEIISEKDKDTVTVTLFKHEFDGSGYPIEIEIKLEEGKDIEELIEEKCLEYLEDDPIIQDLADENITQELLMKIKSRGRGLHIRFNSRVQFFKPYKLFPFLPPYFRTFIIVPLIICNYKNDKKAKTELSQIKGNNSTTIVGPHRVISVGFYGVSWWIGKVSLVGFVVRNGFVGISLLTRIKKL
jgi:hypothetical protein